MFCLLISCATHWNLAICRSKSSVSIPKRLRSPRNIWNMTDMPTSEWSLLVVLPGTTFHWQWFDNSITCLNKKGARTRDTATDRFPTGAASRPFGVSPKETFPPHCCLTRYTTMAEDLDNWGMERKGFFFQKRQVELTKKPHWKMLVVGLWMMFLEIFVDAFWSHFFLSFFIMPISFTVIMTFLKELQVNEEVRVKKPGKVRQRWDCHRMCRLEAQPIGLSMAFFQPFLIDALRLWQ